MSLKLPMLMVSAAVSAGLFVTQPNGGVTPSSWLAAVDADGLEAPVDIQLVADEGRDRSGLEGVAGDIRALRQTPIKTERLTQTAPVVPFQLSQVEQDGAADAGETGPQAGQVPAEVDETALRYFAAQGDTARLAAEIARLRQLYPNWTPPADPLAVPQNIDRQLDDMWQLYAQGRYAEVRKAIVDRRTADPEWEPPADLLDRLKIAEARSRLVNASELKQFQTVVDIGAANPSLLNCSEVDVLWRVAEAFASTDRQQRAVDAYNYILMNCTDPAERLATVQKAAAVLPYDRVLPLLALEKTAENGAGEFAGIQDDLARGFVAQANEDPSLTIAPEYVDRLKASANADGPASDALLLGWYHLRRDDAAEAAVWFARAREREDSADASQGFALTLLEQGKPAEAEAVLYTWRDASEDATATYLAATANFLALDPPPTIDEPLLTRMAEAVISERYAPSAQQFGWYARAFDQPQTAAQWFETALEWAPEDEPSAYGLALTRLQLNDRAGFIELQGRWADRSPRIKDLAATPAGGNVPQPAAGARPVAQPRQAEAVPQATLRGAPVAARSAQVAASASTVVATTPVRRSACASRVDTARLSAAAALQRGWCLMDLNRPLEAAESFGAALSSSNLSLSEDAAYGQSLAYLRLGLTDRAAVAATRAPMSSARARELQGSILADRAVQAFQSDRYREALLYLDQRAQVQQEPVDLMVLRAYSYLNLSRPHDALRLFEAAAATGNRDASRGLADAKAAVGLN
ncbi:MAG: cellulose synthase [Pseudorhizobium sp.]